MNIKHRYLKLAESAAELSNYKRVQIGCAIVKNRDVVGVGYNKEKTHPIQEKYNAYSNVPHKNAYVHAEISAIINTKSESLNGATIYVFRKNKKGELSISKPCNACYQAIRDAGIKRMVYTIENGYAVEEVV